MKKAWVMTRTIKSPVQRRHRWQAEVRSVAALASIVIGFHSLIAKPFYIPSESMMPGLQVGDRLVVSKFPYGWSYTSPSFHMVPSMPGRLFGRLPERGDIVIVTPPDTGRRTEDLIKRVVGLPGDTVQMVAGRLWLNGAPVPVRDVGYRSVPVDGNFHCDARDLNPERAFPGFANARVVGGDGRVSCRVHVLRETIAKGRSYDTIDFGTGAEDDTAPYVVPAGHVFLMGDNRDNSADSRVPIAFNGLGGAVPVENIGGRAEFVTFSLSGDAAWNPASWIHAFRRGRFGLSLRPSDDGKSEAVG
jgi:signal peptidase I